MKIISNTLDPCIERWDDPGDYPNNCVSGPLPSYDYVAEIEGEVVVEIEPGDFLGEKLEIDYDLPHGIKVKKWRIEQALKADTGVRVSLSVEEFDADQVERPEPEYD